MTNKFRRNIIVGFGLSLLLLLLSSLASYISIRNLVYSAGWVNHTNEVIHQIDSVESGLTGAETSQRGFLLTSDSLFIPSYKTDSTNVMRSLDRLLTLVRDNPGQIKNLDSLKKLAARRLESLYFSIDLKSKGLEIDPKRILYGGQLMRRVINHVKMMEVVERELLEARTKKLGTFTRYTPVLIVLAAVISLLITIVFYSRIITDYKQRTQLQDDLIRKDQEISQRIEILEGIANQISAGNYKVRIDAEQTGLLGSLAGSLNKMSESLDYSFGLLSDKEWLQAGIAGLTIEMQGEKNVQTLSKDILQFLVSYTESAVGAFYLRTDNEVLKLTSNYALAQNAREEFATGQGLIGQAAAGKKILHLEGLNPDRFNVSLALGELTPSAVIAVPIMHENDLKAVIELGTVTAFNKNHLTYLEAISQQTGIAIQSALNRQKMQELLEETRAQAEELQVQHSELENINEELRLQSQKLQVSEEELKVQQEELMQTNTELEERTTMLEEKNQLIEERNTEIQQKARELAISARYKSEFLANMSHELRTPLNSILLLSRLMSENNEHNLSADQIEFARVIQTSGQGLLTLIDEILDLSKIESGKMRVDYDEFTIREITNDLNALFLPLAKEKNIQFNIEIDPAAPATIQTDKLRLEQILKNLISNAIKFTSQGYVRMSVKKHSRTSDALVFAVEDTGIGIPEDKQQLVFDAFQQADGSTRRQYGGTGLGLSISRELARLLGGQIELQSTPGAGSVFSCIIPISKPDDGDTGFSDNTPENETSTEPRKNSEELISELLYPQLPDDRDEITTADKVILIIEDDVPFARMLVDFSRTKGYKAIAAVRGDEGLELARKFRPSGILLDISLPIKNGWEVIKELKENARTKHIPVHVMSSNEVRTQSLTNGAIDFINKPVAFEKMGEVFQNIETVLKRDPRKVLIVEENPKHAEALSFFLENFEVKSVITANVEEATRALLEKDVTCVILDMGTGYQKSYDALEQVKKNPGLEELPIIIFTGKHLSKAEEARIRQYADSIVIKTAHSYQRILDEVSLFLHLMEENRGPSASPFKKLGRLSEVLNGKKVLIADDDVRNIFSLTKALENVGMTILSATDGKEALQQLLAHPSTDIVLMDMMMPEMDGYESMKEIRALTQFQKLPIIAITAKAMAGDREKCIRSGASDYITKPVDTDQLLSLLRVWLYERL